MILNNKFGYAFYLLARNDWSWKFLTKKEQEKVIADNYIHNNEREDYANPEKYKDGESIYCNQNPEKTYLGAWLKNELEEQKPKKVLEIGPGSGFYTKLILNVDCVLEYTGLDINNFFLEYIRKGVEEWKNLLLEKRSYNLVNKVIEEFDGDEYDAIVMMYSIHHIPDRVELFKKLSKCLKKGGKIYSVDPSHYIPRIRMLIPKIYKEYWPSRHWEKRGNLSTHHFCSLGEFKFICKKVDSLQIHNTKFYYRNEELKKKLMKWGIKSSVATRWVSNTICAVFVKK